MESEREDERTLDEEGEGEGEEEDESERERQFTLVTKSKARSRGRETPQRQGGHDYGQAQGARPLRATTTYHPERGALAVAEKIYEERRRSLKCPRCPDAAGTLIRSSILYKGSDIPFIKYRRSYQCRLCKKHVTVPVFLLSVAPEFARLAAPKVFADIASAAALPPRKRLRSSPERHDLRASLTPRSDRVSERLPLPSTPRQSTPKSSPSRRNAPLDPAQSGQPKDEFLKLLRYLTITVQDLKKEMREMKAALAAAPSKPQQVQNTPPRKNTNMDLSVILNSGRTAPTLTLSPEDRQRQRDRDLAQVIPRRDKPVKDAPKKGENEKPTYAQAARSGRPSYLEMAQKVKHIPEDRKKQVADALAALHRPPRTLDQAFRVKRVYVSNMLFQKVSSLKKLLTTCDFEMRRIVNISFIGKSVVEFMIHESYTRAFLDSLKMFDFKIMDKFDPARPKKEDAPKDVKDAITARYVARISNIARQCPRTDVRKYYCNALRDAGVADLPDAIEKEMAIAAAAAKSAAAAAKTSAEEVVLITETPPQVSVEKRPSFSASPSVVAATPNDAVMDSQEVIILPPIVLCDAEMSPCIIQC